MLSWLVNPNWKPVCLSDHCQINRSLDYGGSTLKHFLDMNQPGLDKQPSLMDIWILEFVPKSIFAHIREHSFCQCRDSAGVPDDDDNDENDVVFPRWFSQGHDNCHGGLKNLMA